MKPIPFLTEEEIQKLQEAEAHSSKEQKKTAEQIEAIYTSGQNILVSASAGSGKTFVMAERILDQLARGGDAKQVSNWLQGEVAQFLNAEGKTLEQIELTPENLVEMIAIIEDGTISSKIAKKVFVHLAKNGGGAREYVEKAGMVQISDPAVLIPIIHQVFADNEAAVADFKSGKRNADKAFTGFLMKATKGQANPQVALKLLAQELAKLKEDE